MATRTLPNISPEKIKKIISLWKTPTFAGSYLGLSSFQMALKLDQNIDISRKDLRDIMQTDEDFLLETRKIKKMFPRREMNSHGFCSTWQSDVGFMFTIDSYIGFLVCVDVFSRKIFCRAIKSKTAESVQKAFLKIFRMVNDKPDVLETDQGSEFLGNKTFFKEEKIFLKFKTGANKASFAENAILLIKRKLFRLLRTLLTRNWPKYLPTVVRSLNNTPHQALGGLRPSIITSRKDTPLIDGTIGFHPDTPFQTQQENQKKYELNPTKLQVGAYVYVNFLRKPLEKSFDSPNYQLYIVSRVDAGKSPPLYQIKDLKGKIKRGFFYREQLLEGQEPKKGQFFRVEKILKKKKTKKTTLYFVKYMNYPKKYNSWVTKENMIL